MKEHRLKTAKLSAIADTVQKALPQGVEIYVPKDQPETGDGVLVVFRSGKKVLFQPAFLPLPGLDIIAGSRAGTYLVKPKPERKTGKGDIEKDTVKTETTDNQD